MQLPVENLRSRGGGERLHGLLRDLKVLGLRCVVCVCVYLRVGVGVFR